jgi:heptosyltransferase-3
MERLLFIQARNLGDAVISTAFINSVGASFPDCQIDVLTRPSLRDVFDGNPYVHRLYFANFPWGTVKNFGPGEAFRLMKTLFALRREKFDRCFNNFGDGRENFIGRLSGARENSAILISDQNRFRPIIRRGPASLVDHWIPVPDSVFNVYDIARFCAERFDCKKIEPPKIFLKTAPRPREFSPSVLVGIHPTASQESKMWTWPKWSEVVDGIVGSGRAVRLFCAPGERALVEGHLPPVRWGGMVEISASPVREFLNALAGVDLLIGLDSFSVHAAHALGVPSVMLSGATDTEGWAPPSATVLSKGNLCEHYPCFNKPKCKGTSGEFVCMREIEASEVLAAALARLNGRPELPRQNFIH